MKHGGFVLKEERTLGVHYSSLSMTSTVLVGATNDACYDYIFVSRRTAELPVLGHLYLACEK
jgi:hypothetical protein